MHAMHVCIHAQVYEVMYVCTSHNIVADNPRGIVRTSTITVSTDDGGGATWWINTLPIPDDTIHLTKSILGTNLIDSTYEGLLKKHLLQFTRARRST